MLIMGLDTSLQCCSVAILKDGVVLANQSANMERGHAEHIAPMAAAALAEAGIIVRDLDRVGVVVGPGGFAGVRIGLSFARGLAIGTGIEAIGITSLAALAENLDGIDQGALRAPVIDARRGEVYGGLYQPCGAVLVAPFVASPAKTAERLATASRARPVLLLGSGAAQVASHRPDWTVIEKPSQISARHVARLAAAAPSPNAPPGPLYLRAPDAKPPKPGRLDGLSGP